MVKSSCKGCLKRHIGCHSTCIDYITYKEIHKVEMEKIKKEKSKANLTMSYIIDRHDKYVRDVYKNGKRV